VRGPGALQVVNEHPWGPKAHAFAVTFLPTFIGDHFQVNSVAQPHDLMHQATMHTLAMRFQFAFFGRFAPPGGLVASAVFPDQPFPATLLGTTSLIVVAGIGCSPLPVHFMLQATQLSDVRSELRTEQVQPGFCLARDDGDGDGGHS
jgi:hypothetical protein